MPMIGWRDGVLAAAVAAEFAVICGCLCAAAQEQPEQPEHATPCGGDAIARGTASRVIDGRTFVLDDGREVRLAAIEVPPPLPLPQQSGAAPGVAAKDALAALVAGAEIVLRRAQAASDRYGRVLWPMRRPRAMASSARRRRS
jgi:hypothetical protein